MKYSRIVNGISASIYNVDCVKFMEECEPEKFQLTVTSPPYDNLRNYDGDNGWSFEKFKKIAALLYKVTKQGGVVVWVVGDATIDGSETGTSFKQALYFKECGFKLYDTMIYQKVNPLPMNDRRYNQCFDYMFVFSKGKPTTFNPIMVKSSYSGYTYSTKGRTTFKEGQARKPSNKEFVVNPTKIHDNIFGYGIGGGKTGHPAVFPQKLADEQVFSWSNKGDIVFDPFLGSGTTGIAAFKEHRSFVGTEISSKYFEIAQNRISNEMRNPTFF